MPERVGEHSQRTLAADGLANITTFRGPTIQELALLIFYLSALNLHGLFDVSPNGARELFMAWAVFNVLLIAGMVPLDMIALMGDADPDTRTEEEVAEFAEAFAEENERRQVMDSPGWKSPHKGPGSMTPGCRLCSATLLLIICNCRAPTKQLLIGSSMASPKGLCTHSWMLRQGMFKRHGCRKMLQGSRSEVRHPMPPSRSTRLSGKPLLSVVVLLPFSCQVREMGDIVATNQRYGPANTSYYSRLVGTEVLSLSNLTKLLEGFAKVTKHNAPRFLASTLFCDVQES